MGLDMYLNKQYYVQNWDHTPKEQRFSFVIQRDDKPTTIPVEKIKEITCEEIYWRKANAIHAWFVKNCQDGEDDCESYEVSLEQLEQLLSIAKQILDDPGKASELLPTQQGFFFGSIEYDQYYFEDLKHTKAGLEKAIEGYKQDEEVGAISWFEYRSSW